MEMQKSVKFIKKNLKVNILKIKKYQKPTDIEVLRIAYVTYKIVYLKNSYSLSYWI